MCDGKGVVSPAVWGVTLNDAGGSEWVTVYNTIPESEIFNTSVVIGQPEELNSLRTDAESME